MRRLVARYAKRAQLECFEEAGEPAMIAEPASVFLALAASDRYGVK